MLDREADYATIVIAPGEASQVTQAHMDVTAESVIEVMKNATSVKGLRFTYEPRVLRFFQGQFEVIE